MKNVIQFFPIQSHSWVPLLSGIALLLVCGGVALLVYYTLKHIQDGIKSKN